MATNLTDGAGQGRCDSDPLTPGTVWAHGYCPTDYSWMGLLGLVMYLMFFAPGTTYLLSIPACNFSFQSFLQRAEFTSCACHAPIYPYFLLHLCCNFIRLTESIQFLFVFEKSFNFLISVLEPHTKHIFILVF